MTVMLASASRSRAAVLASAGIAFEAMPAEVDEEAVRNALVGAGPETIALALAERKALAVSTKYPKAHVIGGDQILWFSNAVINKSADLDSARSLLRKLRGTTHELIGGLVLAEAGTVNWRHASRARIQMRNFSDDFLDEYLAEEGPAALASVGVYRLEGRGAQLIESFEGSYFSVLGLDLPPLLSELRRRGAIAS